MMNKNIDKSKLEYRSYLEKPVYLDDDGKDPYKCSYNFKRRRRNSLITER
jgi:hypothetical protein